MSKRPRSIVLAVLVGTTACVTILQSGSVDTVPGDVAADYGVVASPMKAFLTDGSTVVYPDGGQISSDSIVGVGMRYPIGSADGFAVRSVALDSLVGIEAFQGEVNGPGSVALTVLATGAVGIGTIALAKALFGSCPTFYASDAQGGTLEAEGFSYSIAPLLEGRDLDALGVVADADGVVRLELRNEALETHYINHLQLLAVDHPAGARAIPDVDGAPITVGRAAAPGSALDRSGRDVTRVLSAADGEVFASLESRVRRATGGDPDDLIELSFPRPSGEEAVLTFRLRNSLLNTVLFYDFMLAGAGARGVDWIGRDMARIGEVVRLGRWFQDLMGLRVEAFDGAEWHEVARIADTGPIAWEEVGVRVGVPDTGPVRVRLRFLADAWRVDRVALAEAVEPAAVERLPVARMSQAGGASEEVEALERLARPDDQYLVTLPGTSAILEFDPPAQSPGTSRSYLLASQGYYTEWVRRDWIREARNPARFEPSEGTVEELMARWLERKQTFERDFHASRIPVR